MSVDERPSPAWLSAAPAYQAWLSAAREDRAAFTIPGHKRQAHLLAPELGRLFDSDIPLYGGIDTVKLDAGVVRQAEALGAQCWGADWCRYSTGGSTHANQALALAVGRPGNRVLVARNAHRSTLTGLVLAGLDPVWLPSSIDESTGVPTGLDLGAVARAFDQHPDVVAVFCVEPGYLGTMSDLPALIELAHRRDVPVIVDQAWGAHLGFHPAYPAHALALGADALVTSAHKTLAAWTQASIVLARTSRLDVDRLERGFEAGFTTSPSGTILASIDVARALLASDEGLALLGQLADRVSAVRSALASAGVATLALSAPEPGRFDPAKLVLLLAGSGHDGLALERHLLSQGIAVEMADRDTVVPIVTMLDPPEAVERLRDALLGGLALQCTSPPRPVSVAVQWADAAPRAMAPREAFFARHETVPTASVVGRVSAELIAPYPPGIPVVVPGEILTGATVEALRLTAASGVRIAYASDATLDTFQVVVESGPA